MAYMHIKDKLYLSKQTVYTIVELCQYPLDKYYFEVLLTNMVVKEYN